MSIKVKIVVPFRDRGTDPRRRENLQVVMDWWNIHGYSPSIVSDGLTGDAQFNRHRAYNRAVALFPETDVFVFTEADMLIHANQIHAAAALAFSRPGLVVPFTQYRYLSERVSDHVLNSYGSMLIDDVRDWWRMPVNNDMSIFGMRAESVMDNGKSIGAVNVVSRKTLDMTGGFTEATSGNWYDDNIIEEGFAFLTHEKTRYVPGPAVHLYHLPGWKGEHLTDADKAATAHNKRLLTNLRRNVRQRDYNRVKTLMQYRQEK